MLQKNIMIDCKPAVLTLMINEEIPGFNSGLFMVVSDDLKVKGDYIEHVSGRKLYVNIDLDGSELNIAMDTSECTTLDDVLAKFDFDYTKQIKEALYV